MANKKLAIIAAAILVLVIASVGAVSAFDLFGLFGGPTTDFDTKFMSGTFTGDVVQNEIKNDTTKGWSASFEDKEHNITYNMSCVKDGSFITDVYQLQGLGRPDVRNYNGQPWKIFYSEAVPNPDITGDSKDSNDTNDTNDTKDAKKDANDTNANETINVYICEADINGTAYTINVMAYANQTECDGTMFCPLYKDYIEPLVESIEFKDSKKAPKMSKILNMSDEEFKFNKDYVDGIFNGTIDPNELQQQQQQ